MSFFKSCIFLIFIIFAQMTTSSNLTVANPEINVSYTSLIDSSIEPLLKKTETNVEPHFKENQLVRLNLTSKINSSINLNQGDNHLITSSPYHRNLQINQPKSFRNQFDFSSILIPKLKNYGSGDLFFQAVENDTKLKFAINGSTYTSYISTPLDIAISGNEYLEIKIDDITFNFNQDDFAFANLVIEFNNFNLLMVYGNSQSYIDFGFNQNSTDSIKILNSLLSNTKVNISKLVSVHNLNQPNLIKSISWNIYSNNPYDFSATFSKLKFIGATIPDVKINNQRYILTSNQIIKLNPDTNYTITTTANNTFVQFQAIISTIKFIEENLSINFKDFILTIDGTLSFDNSDLGSFISVIFPENIIIDMVNSSLVKTFYMNNLLSFEYTQQDKLQFSAHFTMIENFDYTINKVSQGSKMKLTIFTNNLIGGKVVGPNNENGNALNTNSTVEYFIPSNWNRGDIFVILWFENGEFSYFSKTLDLYPSKLISPTFYNLNIGERVQIPIIIQNLSSLEYRNAETIKSYYQGDLFSIDTQHGITINPGDFTEGTHLLMVNASYSGLAPLIFELEIVINQFNPDIVYTIERSDINKISINFSIQDVYNWSVSSYMTITGEGIHKTFEIWESKFGIQLTNSNWTNSELEFDLIVSLNDNLGEKFQKIVVPPYEENTNSKNNSNDENSIPLVLGFVGVVSGLGFVGYRFAKNNLGTEKISF